MERMLRDIDIKVDVTLLNYTMIIIRTYLDDKFDEAVRNLTGTTKILRNVSQRRMNKNELQGGEKGIGAQQDEKEKSSSMRAMHIPIRRTWGWENPDQWAREEEILSSRNSLLENCARHVFHTFTLPPPQVLIITVRA